MSTADEVKAFIVAEYLPGTPASELDSSYDLLETGVVDSLGLLQLVAWVGKRYDIAVDDMDLAPENFRSVDAIREFVATHTHRR